MKITLFFSLITALLSLNLKAQRDPFWPIGYSPSAEEPSPQVAETPPPPAPTPEAVRELTDEELKELARQESERITQSFKERSTNAVATMGGKTYAHVGSDMLVSKKKWVSEGDFFIIKIAGQSYRMDVVKLTRTSIELEPRRLPQTP
jgi:hypothetical protein